MQPVNFVRTAEDVECFWSWLSNEPEIAVDTETSGFTCAGDLFSPNFQLRLIQFGSIDNAWVIDFARWRGLVEDVFRRFDGDLLMHNAGYDTQGADAPRASHHRGIASTTR